MKKRATSSVEGIPLYHAPLTRLVDVQSNWNMQVGDILTSRKVIPQALPSLLNGFGEKCGSMLAQIAVDMELLLCLPEIKKLLASLTECKKMEIRRGAIAVTEYVEKSTNKRLHTHLFFQVYDGVAFGEGLDEYKDIMEELVRRLRLLTKMGTLNEAVLQHCIKELKECGELFYKKRESVLEKADIPLHFMPGFSALVDQGLMLPKARSPYHQISLANFDAERSIKIMTQNMAEFFDELHSENTEPMLQQFRRAKSALRKEKAIMPLPSVADTENRVSA